MAERKSPTHHAFWQLIILRACHAHDQTQTIRIQSKLWVSRHVKKISNCMPEQWSYLKVIPTTVTPAGTISAN